jgi:hypothetical protein
LVVVRLASHHSIDGSSSDREHAGELIGPLAAPSSSNDLGFVERLKLFPSFKFKRPILGTDLVVQTSPLS